MPRGKKKEIKNMTVDEIQEKLKECIAFLEELQTKMKDINPQIQQIRDLVGASKDNYSNYESLPSAPNPSYSNNTSQYQDYSGDEIPPEIKALLPKKEPSELEEQDLTRIEGNSTTTPHSASNPDVSAAFGATGVDLGSLQQIDPEKPVQE